MFGPKSREMLVRSLLAACLVAVAGCKATRHAERADEVVEQPADAVAVEGIGATAWCSDFGDAGLEAMVRRAWSDNLDLKAAWARLEQAEAIADVESALLWPSVEANAGASYSQREIRGTPGGEGSATAGTGPEPYWEVSAAASYEVDIFGRYRHRARAARIEVQAFEAAARAVAMTLTSEVAEAWFDVVAQRERMKLLEEQLELSENILKLIEIRLRRGLASALDYAQQQQNVESLRRELAETEALAEINANRLATLVGASPRNEVTPTAQTLPDVEPIGAGMPANLLERRPDVRAEYLFLQAADERTAAAVADRLPRLQLSATIGLGAEQLSSLLQQLFWSIGAGVTQPIWEGGRLSAEVERNEAVAEEQLYRYGSTLLEAIREVRDALVRERVQQEVVESLERERDIARAAFELAQKQYRNAAIDYLRVLTLLQPLQEVERALLDARRQQISHRIGLCRALGGSWVEAVERSTESEDAG